MGLPGMERLLALRYAFLELGEEEQRLFVRDVRDARAKTRHRTKRKDVARIRDAIRGLTAEQLLDVMKRVNGG